MSKKFGVKKIISAALTAASIAGGISASSVVSPAYAATESVTDNWILVASGLKSEQDADARIDGYAEEFWSNVCKSAITDLNLSEAQFSSNRGLSIARGVFNNAIKEVCYAKTKTSKWGGLSSLWNVKVNQTQIDNLRAAVLPILNCYLTNENNFNPRKDDTVGQARKNDILSGVRLVIETELTSYLDRLRNSDAELKNLPCNNELALRRMIFEQAFGKPGEQKGSGQLDLLTLSKSEKTAKTQEMIDGIPSQKKLWEDRIKFLEGKVAADRESEQ